jgi:polyisoprenoid-binding protein YceI
MKRFYLFLLLFPLMLAAQESAKDSLAAEAKVEFTISKFFSDVNGHFTEAEYSIDFKPETPESGSLKGTVAVANIDTDNEERDTELQSESWFNADKHPVISLQTTGIRKISEQNFEADIIVGIKGIEKSYSVTFTYEDSNAQKVIKSTFMLQRDDFDLGGGLLSYMVGDDITIRIELPLP